MIIHVDMDAFYASVEIRDNPKLAGKPVVVGGDPSGRGVICAASYEARKYGIHSAMASSEAKRRCANLIFVKARMEHYAAISKQIRSTFFRFTSCVEPLALDEAFLDVSGCERLFGTASHIAQKIKEQIKAETGLVASAGIGPNKFLAKIASDLNKPDGLTIVDPERVLEFLAPLSIDRVWGVGPKTAIKFERLGVRTIGQLQRLSLDVIQSQLGENAEHFYRLAQGIDARPVVPDRIAKSVSHEHTFAQDIYDDEIVRAWILELADAVGRRLRRHSTYCRTVQLKFRYDDFETVTRRRTIAPTHGTAELHKTACELLASIKRPAARGVRLVGLGAVNLSANRAMQLSLFDQEESHKQSRIDEIADSIRDKFGKSALVRGSNHEHEIRFRPDPRIENE